MAHFSDQVHITVDGFTLNVIHSELKISQKMADHHYFEFNWHYSPSVVIKPADQAAAIRKYQGSEVIFTFLVNGIRLMAKGIITTLISLDKNGSPDGLYVRGISHTVVLNDRKKSRIYLETPLQNIVPGILAEGPSEFYQKDAIAPTYQKEFKYLAQYNESSFDFLKRLAIRYGQWFYFDGMRMQFGQLKPSKVKLVNNSSLENFKIESNLTSHKYAIGAYDFNNFMNVKNSASKTSEGSADSFAKNIGYKQGAIAQPDLTDGSHTSNAENKDEIDEMIKLQTAGNDANSIFYSGTSYFPIGVGQTFTITNDNIVHELLAVEVTHLSKLRGNYTCEFKAIPADVSAPHYTNVEVFAKADTQPAVVTDNNDPEQMGRVRVKFNWGNGINTSDWIRMIQPYSGGQKGFYFIPEIGEEVLVGFEDTNIQRPYVMGAQYNGKAKPAFSDPGNYIKGWKLRFGQLFKFIEKIGIWLSDPSGNEIHLDEEGKNINVTSPETVTIRAKNIVFEAAESITLKAGTNIENTADHNISYTAENNITVTASGNLFEKSDNRTEFADQDYIKTVGGTSGEIAGKMHINSTEGNIDMHSAKDLNGHSGENSNFH